MSAAWPDVVGRLVVMWRSFGPTPVYDGIPATSAAPPDYVTVGYVEDDVGGSFTVEPIYDGYRVGENGTVVCRVVAQSGGTDITSCRARAFALADAMESLVRADPSLGGVLSDDSTCTLSTEIQSASNQNGVAQALDVTVTYFTTY